MNGNARTMSNCSTSIFLLAAIAAVPLGCSSHPSQDALAHQGHRPGILLLLSAHNDAEEIGSLAPEAAAEPANLGDYRRPCSTASLQRTAVSRHPFR